MDTRIGDAEREGATARLNDHFAAGRLDHEEYAERLDAIWSARTRADLDQLFWDLPRAPAPVVPARPAPVARRGMPTFVPVLVIAVLVGVAVLEGAPLVLLIAAVWFVFLRPHRRHARHGHGRMGACR
ncbi:DUF1707 domain-containing protein [Nocardioides sp.]|uniref:DUF1707 SHOCT-like domain-containing protein n=1 Tax=Nocardioides sp. TaxID=35761 RepID=UPI002CC9C4BB|nr:DUF1707 domain-containing protein [Nocardioides sp.]HXH79306.1 DUF1707 domain-containing protein [Nocardioides sp.]